MRAEGRGSAEKKNIDILSVYGLQRTKSHRTSTNACVPPHPCADSEHRHSGGVGLKAKDMTADRFRQHS